MKKTIILFIPLFLILNLKVNSYNLPAPTIYSQHCDTLFWSRVVSATYYKIQIATDLYFQNVVLDSSHIPDTMFVLPNGFGNLQAYYHVRAFNSADTSNWSLTQILSSFLPPPPVVIGVIDTTADTLTIAWRRVPNAISYRLQVSFYQNFSAILINTVLVDTCWHILSGTLIGDMIYYYRISSINSCGQGPWSPVYHFTRYHTGIKKISNEFPDKFKLSQNYPNPFNPVTKIKFVIQAQNSPLIKGEERSGGGCQVSLIIYDLTGREVVTLVNEQLQPGTYEVEWPAPSGDASNFSSGVYFYKLAAGDFVETKKMVLMK